MVYEVWDDVRAAEAELARVRAELDAGPDTPQRAAFTVPDYFAAGFGRWPRSRAAAPVAPVAVPAPRAPEPAPAATPAS
jgi:hypothetical protein